MKPQEVIDAYLLEVMRFLPRKDRNEIAFELRGLLSEMLNDKALEQGRAADDAMVLALLRDFGSPVEIARRYRVPGIQIIPDEQTTSFTLLSLVGIAVQWATTFPRTLNGQSLGEWWLGNGLGALWWPGFLVTMALLVAWARHYGLLRSDWRPRIVDPDRIQRTAWVFALIGTVGGMLFMTSLPWLVQRLPAPLASVFAFAPEFLTQRTWPALFLWAGSVALGIVVWQQDGWTALTRRLELVLQLAFVALLTWWLAAGEIFVMQTVTDATKNVLGFVVLLISLSLAIKAFARRPKIRPPNVA